MKNKISDWYRGVNDWWNYVRNYKEYKFNEELSEQTIVELKKKVQADRKQREYIEKEKDNLILLRNKRVQTLTDEVSSLKKRCDELRKTLKITSDQVDALTIQLKEKEDARRKCAGTIGGLKKYINKLTKELKHATECRDGALKELDQAMYTIKFYKTHQKSPSLEELKAYEYSRKEVERRQKNESMDKKSE